MCGYHKHSDTEDAYFPPPLPTDRLLLSWDIKRELKKAHETRFIWYVWRNLYRRDLLKKNQLYFLKTFVLQRIRRLICTPFMQRNE